MHALLIAVALAADPAAVATPPTVYTAASTAADALSHSLTTGTLLFSRGDCLAVKAFTGSPYTHVAAVVVSDGTWVYDSQNGVGVRRLSLVAYLDATRPDDLLLLHPRMPFDPDRADRFVARLNADLGRPYGIAHHLTGRRAEGVHCAEYLTDALSDASLIVAQHPSNVSPASLLSGLRRHDLYAPGGMVAVLVPKPERAPGRTWCHELWLDTKDCYAGCWSGFRRCVLCR